MSAQAQPEFQSGSVAVIAAPESAEADRVVQMMTEGGVQTRLIRMPSPREVSLSLKIGEQDIIAAPLVAVLLLDKNTGEFSDHWSAMSRNFVRESNIIVFGLNLITDKAGSVMPNILGDVISVVDTGSIERAIDELCFRINEAVAAKKQALSTVPEQQEESAQSSSSTQSASNDYTCTFTDNSGTPVATYSVTADLASLLFRARALHVDYQSNRIAEPDIAFTSLLFAGLTLNVPFAQWFQAFVQRSSINIAAGLRRIQRTPDFLQSLAAEVPVYRNISLSPSISVRALFSDAQLFTANAALDVRHIIAAFIYKSDGHRAELAEWNFNREQWSNSFLGFIAQYYPDDTELYRQQHIAAFSAQPEPTRVDVPKQAPPRGPSTHIDSDRWTVDDTLGYDAYAHAIYRFLVHEKTKSPLTISIQAPWGGGKTSLMRMIQKRLDPEAVPDADTSSMPGEEQGKDRLSVRGVIEEINKWTAGVRKQEVAPLKDRPHRKMTVWFNAWKYESVNQVWAGLADAIMQQVTARMPVAERERFWLHLHFRRVDADAIRQKVYDRIFQRTLRFAVKALPIVVCAIAMGVIAIAGGFGVLGWILTGGSLPAGMVAVFIKYFSAKKKVEEEPADISLSEYVRAPDYSTELGFIHHAERDLQRVFECIPAEYKPLVVFIDDLDRCSPGNVAKVMEAVNLFLAGEFPNCIFVLGMDSELVAAALQAAHREMIAALDNHAKTPVGWRFMDKFIQLPFIIPPCESNGIDRYTTALFSSRSRPEQQHSAPPPAHSTASTIRATEAAVVPEEQRRAPRPTAEEIRNIVRQKIDEGIREFSDDNPEIEQYIAQGKAYFRGNPREMKRFANTFRFHYFLRWAREAQPGAESPTPEQVVRWTVLAMKWPEVARWLHSGFGAGVTAVGGAGDDRSGVRTRLQRIEKCSLADTPEQWKNAVAEEFLSTGDQPYHWIGDGDLFCFFQKEANLPEGERLSAGAGRGLW